MPKSKAPPGTHHPPHHQHHSHQTNQPDMDQVKIKRVKRNKKKPTAKEKVLAGLGVGGALMGGIGAVSPKPSQTQFVRTDEKSKGSAKEKMKDLLKGVFGAKTAKANLDEGDSMYTEQPADAAEPAVYDQPSYDQPAEPTWEPPATEPAAPEEPAVEPAVAEEPVYPVENTEPAPVDTMPVDVPSEPVPVEPVYVEPQAVEPQYVEPAADVPDSGSEVGGRTGTSVSAPDSYNPPPPAVLRRDEPVQQPAEPAAPTVPQYVEPVAPTIPQYIEPVAPVVPQYVEPVTPTAPVSSTSANDSEGTYDPQSTEVGGRTGTSVSAPDSYNPPPPPVLHRDEPVVATPAPVVAGPQEGDTKYENGIEYTYHNGQWTTRLSGMSAPTTPLYESTVTNNNGVYTITLDINGTQVPFTGTVEEIQDKIQREYATRYANDVQVFQSVAAALNNIPVSHTTDAGTVVNAPSAPAYTGGGATAGTNEQADYWNWFANIWFPAHKGDFPPSANVTTAEQAANLIGPWAPAGSNTYLTQSSNASQEWNNYQQSIMTDWQYMDAYNRWISSNKNGTEPVKPAGFDTRHNADGSLKVGTAGTSTAAKVTLTTGIAPDGSPTGTFSIKSTGLNTGGTGGAGATGQTFTPGVVYNGSSTPKVGDGWSITVTGKPGEPVYSKVGDSVSFMGYIDGYGRLNMTGTFTADMLSGGANSDGKWLENWYVGTDPASTPSAKPVGTVNFTLTPQTVNTFTVPPASTGAYSAAVTPGQNGAFTVVVRNGDAVVATITATSAANLADQMERYSTASASDQKVFAALQGVHSRIITDNAPKADAAGFKPVFFEQGRLTATTLMNDGVTKTVVPLNAEYYATQATAEYLAQRYGGVAKLVISDPEKYKNVSTVSPDAQKWWVIEFPDGTQINAGSLARFFTGMPDATADDWVRATINQEKQVHATGPIMGTPFTGSTAAGTTGGTGATGGAGATAGGTGAKGDTAAASYTITTALQQVTLSAKAGTADNSAPIAFIIVDSQGNLVTPSLADISLSSSKTSIATVTKAADHVTITGKSAGTSVVTIAYKGATAKIAVTVAAASGASSDAPGSLGLNDIQPGGGILTMSQAPTGTGNTGDTSGDNGAGGTTGTTGGTGSTGGTSGGLTLGDVGGGAGNSGNTGNTSGGGTIAGITPFFTTINPPNGFVGQNYGTSIQAVSNYPMTFALIGGSLPGGLSMNSSGQITGKPTVAGTYAFVVQATTNQGVSATKQFTLVIGTGSRSGSSGMFYGQSDGLTMANLTGGQQVAGTQTFTGLTMPGPGAQGSGLRYQNPGLQYQAPAAEPKVEGASTYTVKKGDTLWKIAKKLTGDGRNWRKILDANPGALSKPGDTKTLKTGVVLNIPKI